MATRIRSRLGDILIRMKRLKPHQLGVALAVQRRTGLPLGQVLVGADLISKAQLRLALFRQLLMRTPLASRSLRKQAARYGADLAAFGQELLDTHLRRVEKIKSDAPHPEEILRAERAGLPPGRVARIVEPDEALAERLRSGNF